MVVLSLESAIEGSIEGHRKNSIREVEKKRGVQTPLWTRPDPSMDPSMDPLWTSLYRPFVDSSTDSMDPLWTSMDPQWTP